MSTTAAPAPATRANRAPDIKDGDLALWAETTRTGKDVYKIAEGKKDEPKVYTDVYPAINGVKLEPKEALAIYKGDSLKVQMEGKNGPYDVTLTKRAIEERPWANNPEKTDRVMTVAMVFDLQKKDTKENYGYQIDGIRVFNSAGRDADRVKLEPQDAMRLLNGETLQKGALTVKLDRVSEEVSGDKTFKTARVSATKGPQETLTSPEQQVPLGEAARPKVAV